MNVFQSEPYRFHAGLTIAILSQKSAYARYWLQHVIERGHGGPYFGVQQVGRMNFIRIEEPFGSQVVAGSAQSHQVGDTPRHHHAQRQGAFQLLNQTESKCFDLAGIFSGH